MVRFLLLFLSISFMGFAFEQAAIAAGPDLALLKRVEMYLDSLTTIQANFVQISAEGNVVTGKFFLKRPGKMRWQYDPPVPVLMISSGKTLTYYDYELQQINEIPLDDTLVGFLAKNKISFNPAVIKVLEATSKDGVVRIRITQARNEGQGELTLELSDRPLALRNFIVKDAQGKETNVSLGDARFAVKLDDTLFLFRDPRMTQWPSQRK